MKKLQPIVKLKPITDFCLIAEFKNGEKRLYDMKSTLNEYKVFKELKDNKELFDKAKICPLGYGVEWTDKIDLDSEDIYYDGKKITNEEYLTY